jgi:Phage integrase, N-terminal SAM-like domain
MTNRRGRGEGNITERNDGRWMARVDLGWKDGKRRYKAYYGKTRSAVAKKLTKAMGDLQKGVSLPDERQTVAGFLERWLEHKRTRMRPRAWLTYEQTVRLHLCLGSASWRSAD